MTRVLKISSHLILLPVLLTATSTQAERTFKWVDADGNVHYGSSVPPQYSTQQRREINEQGRTIKVYEAPKTPEQKAEEKRLAAIEAENKKRREAQARLDRSLLATYANEEDMLRARDDKIASVDALMHLTKSRISSMKKRLDELTQEAAEYERSGKRIPKGLTTQINSNREQIIQNEKFLEAKRLEKQGIERKYGADMRRFRELTQEQDSPDIGSGSVATARPSPPPVGGTVKRDVELSQYDSLLLATYRNEQELLLARERQIAPVDAVIQDTYSQLDSMHTRLTELSEDADKYLSSGRTLPESLLIEMKRIIEKIAHDEELLERKRGEKEVIEKKFTADIARYRELQASN